jgi:hypothetical protein
MSDERLDALEARISRLEMASLIRGNGWTAQPGPFYPVLPDDGGWCTREDCQWTGATHIEHPWDFRKEDVNA